MRPNEAMFSVWENIVMGGGNITNSEVLMSEKG